MRITATGVVDTDRGVVDTDTDVTDTGAWGDSNEGISVLFVLRISELFVSGTKIFGLQQKSSKSLFIKSMLFEEIIVLFGMILALIEVILVLIGVDLVLIGLILILIGFILVLIEVILVFF
jgi:hypothetical protein